MLNLTFAVGDEQYAIDSSQVIEVVPWVRLKNLPNSPESVSGLLNYRGKIVPVLDLSHIMLGRFSIRCLSTRIILVNYHLKDKSKHILGILVERIMESQKQKESSFIDSGVRLKKAPYLGKIAIEGHDMVQTISVEDLVPETLKGSLFVNND